MNIWDILEIQTTQDIKLIKKAYARKLKQHHPEDDPIGYQQLREAYDEAIRYAKHVADYFYASLPQEFDQVPESEPVLNLDYINVESLDAKPKPLYDGMLEVASQPDFEKLNKEFIQNMQGIYADFFRRVDIQQWINLFDSEVIWNMYNRDTIGEEVLAFLSTRRNLPQNIWIFLNLNFNWVSQLDFYYGSYEEVIEYVDERLQEKEELSYSFDDDIIKIDYDMYLNLRENAHQAVKKIDINSAYNYLYKAKSIYPSDAELLFIEGACLFHQRKVKEAMDCFNALMNKNPNHIVGLSYRARLYLGKQQYALALADLKTIECFCPGNEGMLYMMSRCYRMLKNLDLAKTYAVKLSMINPKFQGLEELINRINKAIFHNVIIKLAINPFNKNLWGQYKKLKIETAKTKEKGSGKKRFIKTIIYILILILCIAFIISTGTGSIIGLIFLLRFIFRKEKCVENEN